MTVGKHTAGGVLLDLLKFWITSYHTGTSSWIDQFDGVLNEVCDEVIGGI